MTEEPDLQKPRFGPDSSLPDPSSPQGLRLAANLDGSWRLLGLMADHLYSTELEMIEGALKTIVEGGDVEPRLHERPWTLTSLAQGMLTTAHAVLRETKARDIDSAYILARALVERAINFSYLAVAAEEEVSNWVAYSRQKKLRLLVRRGDAGSIRYQLHPEVTLDDLPEEARLDLEQFTSPKSGREITRWTRLSLEQRIAALDGGFDRWKFPATWLLQAMTNVYAIGAEAQHGTLLGVGLPLGLLAFPGESVNDHLGILLLAVIQCMESGIETLAYLTGHQEWASEAMEAFQETIGLMQEPFAGTQPPA